MPIDADGPTLADVQKTSKGHFVIQTQDDFHHWQVQCLKCYLKRGSSDSAPPDCKLLMDQYPEPCQGTWSRRISDSDYNRHEIGKKLEKEEKLRELLLALADQYPDPK